MPTHRKTKPEQNNSLKDFDLPIWWVEQVLKQKQHLRKLKFNDTDELIPLVIWKNLTILTNPRKPNVSRHSRNLMSKLTAFTAPSQVDPPQQSTYGPTGWWMGKRLDSLPGFLEGDFRLNHDIETNVWWVGRSSGLSSTTLLVSGFNPFEKYLSTWIISPVRGEKNNYFK